MVVTIIQENLQTINVLQVSFYSTKYRRQSNLKKREREDSKAIFHCKTCTVMGTNNTVSHFLPTSDFK